MATIFSVVDEDNSGTIDAAEFQHVIELLQVQPTTWTGCITLSLFWLHLLGGSSTIFSQAPPQRPAAHPQLSTQPPALPVTPAFKTAVGVTFVDLDWALGNGLDMQGFE